MNSEYTSRSIEQLSPAALERLIYVVGSARGGTSLTKDVIGAHDNVISFHGPTHFLNHPWKHRKRLDPRLWNIVFWLPENVRRAEVRDSLGAAGARRLHPPLSTERWRGAISASSTSSIR